MNVVHSTHPVTLCETTINQHMYDHQTLRVLSHTSPAWDEYRCSTCSCSLATSGKLTAVVNILSWDLTCSATWLATYVQQKWLSCCLYLRYRYLTIVHVVCVCLSVYLSRGGVQMHLPDAWTNLLKFSGIVHEPTI